MGGIHSANPQCRDSANEREGYIANHQQRLLDGMECEIKQEEDDAYNDRDNQHQPARCSLLIFKLTSIGNRDVP
jgi:hypothetical protein